MCLISCWCCERCGPSFRLELRDEMQGEIPPFRSSYQTSAFLATNLVTGDPNDGWNPCSGEAQLTQWLSQPRIFEIERTGDVLPFPARQVITQNIAQAQNGCQNVPPPVAQND